MTNPSPEKQREHQIYKVTIIGSLVSLFLILVKFPAGILGRSSAMIADAVHSLSDFVTDIIVIAFVRTSQKPKDEKHAYGHGKFETLASLIIGIVLLGVGLGIAWNGATTIYSVIQGEILPKPSIIAFIAALATIASKEILYHYTIIKGKKLNSPALIANAWHHRSDGLSSIGTAIGIGGAIFLGDKWTVLDPLAALVVSFFIIQVALKLTKPCLDELLERSLPEDVIKEIEETVGEFKDVYQLHNLRTRKIGNYYAIEFHIRMDGNKSLEETHARITEIELKLKELYGNNTYVTIHVEPNKS
ncbi:MAG: cation diffusion facilitator family transporter [Bacteroidetes bacterium]|nr:cation diffusion facilitator family transporter [Bacteroidota bacterium]MCL2303505.1 cation diffusion facilitator family transporter [Lentimicrobiaceae bacterium]